MKLGVSAITFGIALAALCWPSCPAGADDRLVSPKDVLSVVTADWNGDGRFDRAVLVASATEADDTVLFVYLSDAATERMHRRLTRKGLAWRGAAWGTQPWLDTDEEGNLLVVSENQSVGRHRWTLKLTIGFETGGFAVTGYSLLSRDAVAGGAEAACRVNYATGKGQVNDASFTLPPGAIPVARWSDRHVPRECRW